jgi:uncharacterized protein
MSSLMTAAPQLATSPDWFPTGNLYVALPQLSRLDAGIYSVGATSLKDNGLLELCGAPEEGLPFLRPLIELDGRRLALADLRWERLDGWLPRFTCQATGLEISGTIFAPLDEKGFVYLLEVTATQDGRVNLGLEGWWKSLDLVVFSGRALEAKRLVWRDSWTGSLVGEASSGLPLLAWGMQPDQEAGLTLEGEHYRWETPFELKAGQTARAACYISLNLERDGARSGALHLRRMGWQRLLSETRAWLIAHSHDISDPTLSRIFHENLFFNYFYAQSRCLDQPELVLMTSRSRSYYVCAAYWARDACLWSFPGLLLVDRRQARRALQAILTRYLPEAAQHALYLNGQTLYPGFELDQACAPLIALEHYLQVTGKRELFQQAWLPAALSQAYQTISGHYDAQTGLYGTFLTPHDDPTGFPYLTFNNVLVWRALQILADLDDAGATHYRSASHLKRASHLKSASHLRQQAEKLKLAILKKCVRQGPFGPQYVAAVDAEGACDWNDLPGASWSLFPYYGFCSAKAPLYLNSLRWIYSEHNPHYYPGPFGGAGTAHFPFPSCFDLTNRLLRKDPAALELIKQLKMDHGLACESFDSQTGAVRTGAAFATLAGFLAYALSEY